VASSERTDQTTGAAATTADTAPATAPTATPVASTGTRSPSSPTATDTNAAADTRSGAAGLGSGQRGWGEEGLGGSSGTASPEASVIDGLRCDLLMNARYHSSREAFLDTLHRVLMFLIIVLGAAAVSDLLSAHIQWIRGSFAACAVVFASADLTADLSNRARCHALMKRRYFELLADLIAGKSPLEVESLMHRFSADEEPAFHALLGACWNAAQEMVYGKFADAYKIPLWHRALKNCFRFGRKYDVIIGPRPAAA
jgi:hypothetical protein